MVNQDVQSSYLRHIFRNLLPALILIRSYQCCVFGAQEKQGSKFVVMLQSGSRSRSRSGPRRPDGDAIEMVVLTSQAETKLQVVVDTLFSARVELGPGPAPVDPEHQAARSSAEEPDPKIREWCDKLEEAEEIVRKVKEDIYRVHKRVLLEHFGVNSDGAEWTQMVHFSFLEWTQMVHFSLSELRWCTFPWVNSDGEPAEQTCWIGLLDRIVIGALFNARVNSDGEPRDSRAKEKKTFLPI